MNLPAIVTVSATIPFFAAAISDEARSGKEDLIAVLYVAAAGLVISCAALLDDMWRQAARPEGGESHTQQFRDGPGPSAARR